MSNLQFYKKMIQSRVEIFILQTLSEQDKYGKEILDEINKKGKGVFSLKIPTLYALLKRLQDDLHLVTSYQGSKSRGGKRRYYHLTDLGIEALEKNRREWEFSRTLLDLYISDEPFDLDNDVPPIPAYALKPSSRRTKIIHETVETTLTVPSAANADSSIDIDLDTDGFDQDFVDDTDYVDDDTDIDIDVDVDEEEQDQPAVVQPVATNEDNTIDLTREKLAEYFQEQLRALSDIITANFDSRLESVRSDVMSRLDTLSSTVDAAASQRTQVDVVVVDDNDSDVSQSAAHSEDSSSVSVDIYSTAESSESSDEDTAHGADCTTVVIADDTDGDTADVAVEDTDVVTDDVTDNVVSDLAVADENVVSDEETDLDHDSVNDDTDNEVELTTDVSDAEDTSSVDTVTDDNYFVSAPAEHHVENADDVAASVLDSITEASTNPLAEDNPYIMVDRSFFAAASTARVDHSDHALDVISDLVDQLTTSADANAPTNLETSAADDTSAAFTRDDSVEHASESASPVNVAPTVIDQAPIVIDETLFNEEYASSFAQDLDEIDPIILTEESADSDTTIDVAQDTADNIESVDVTTDETTSVANNIPPVVAVDVNAEVDSSPTVNNAQTDAEPAPVPAVDDDSSDIDTTYYYISPTDDDDIDNSTANTTTVRDAVIADAQMSEIADRLDNLTECYVQLTNMLISNQTEPTPPAESMSSASVVVEYVAPDSQSEPTTRSTVDQIEVDADTDTTVTSSATDQEPTPVTDYVQPVAVDGTAFDRVFATAAQSHNFSAHPREEETYEQIRYTNPPLITDPNYDVGVGASIHRSHGGNPADDDFSRYVNGNGGESEADDQEPIDPIRRETATHILFGNMNARRAPQYFDPQSGFTASGIPISRNEQSVAAQRAAAYKQIIKDIFEHTVGGEMTGANATRSRGGEQGDRTNTSFEMLQNKLKSEGIDLRPYSRTAATDEFYSLSYVHKYKMHFHASLLTLILLLCELFLTDFLFNKNWGIPQSTFIYTAGILCIIPFILFLRYVISGNRSLKDHDVTQNMLIASLLIVPEVILILFFAEWLFGLINVNDFTSMVVPFVIPGGIMLNTFVYVFFYTILYKSKRYYAKK